MTLDQLNYFVIAANLQHVGNAAVAAHISPSVISSTIKTLEYELGVSLFKKQGRNIRLTLEGEAFKQEAKKILGQVSQMKNRIMEKTKNLEGTFRLCSTHLFSNFLLAPALAEIQSKYPKIVIEMYSISTNQINAEVLSGRIDLGLCLTPLRNPEIEEAEIYRGNFVITVRKGHPILKKKGMKKFEELNNYPNLIFKVQAGIDFCESDPVFKKLNIKLNVSTYFDDDKMAVEFLKNSDAWAFQPDIIENYYNDELAYIKLPKGFQSTYRISLINHSSNTAVKALQEKIVKILKRKVN
jgi:DNA-binding transcriptional LysR family regulator